MDVFNRYTSVFILDQLHYTNIQRHTKYKFHMKHMDVLSQVAIQNFTNIPALHVKEKINYTHIVYHWRSEANR